MRLLAEEVCDLGTVIGAAGREAVREKGGR
jgi:hypothetical protein